VGAGFDKWWLLPVGIFAASLLVVLGVIVLGPSILDRSSAEVKQRATSEPPVTSKVAQPAPSEPTGTREVATAVATAVAPVDCSGASVSEYACYQRRYQALVRELGVEAAFAELKGEIARDDLASSNCHQLTHVIGRVAAEIYGDISGSYARGDSLCGSGYYHGVMETVVAKIGPEKVLEEANTLCADLRERQERSIYHYNCAHGLGHGFMGIQENELFESLETCETLPDTWERNRCYGGVFMENVLVEDDPSHPSKYLKADRPLYPCDEVGTRYKDECYQRQTSEALKTQGNDFARVFDLCSTVEDGFRPSCYQGIGWDASVQSLKRSTGAAAINEATGTLCVLGEDYEAQFNCVVGAVEYFIRHYYSDAQARAFCESLGANLRSDCLREAEEYYGSLQSPLERRRTSS
jgi:hypothetical protein